MLIYPLEPRHYNLLQTCLPLSPHKTYPHDKLAL